MFWSVPQKCFWDSFNKSFRKKHFFSKTDKADMFISIYILWGINSPVGMYFSLFDYLGSKSLILCFLIKINRNTFNHNKYLSLEGCWYQVWMVSDKKLMKSSLFKRMTKAYYREGEGTETSLCWDFLRERGVIKNP